MSEEKRDLCRLVVGRGTMQIYYRRDDPPAEWSGSAAFDHDGALALNQSPGRLQVQDYGRALYDLLLLADTTQQVSAIFNRSFDDSRLVQLRLELLDRALGDLLGLSWEHLCDPNGRYLSMAGDRFRVTRWLASVPETKLEPLPEAPRVLVVVANPADLDSFQMTLPGPAGDQVYRFAAIEAPFNPQQSQGLDRLFSDLKRQGQLADYRILNGAIPSGQSSAPPFLAGYSTLDRIHEALEAAGQAGQPFHVLHFLAHGFLDEQGEGRLLLSNDNGGAAPIHQDAFQSLFPAGHQVRLVVFAACQSGGGRQAISHPLAGLAPAILRLGIPAVLAMQDEVSIQAAAAFTETFYQGLAAHGYVDTAVGEARREVQRRAAGLPSAGATAGEWFIPVLYLQNDKPRLFNREAVPPATSLARPDFAIQPPARFVDRADELDTYSRVLWGDVFDEPKICWLSGPQKVGKYTLLHQLRYLAYQAGHGHLMMTVNLPLPVNAPSATLHELMVEMLRPLDGYPAANRYFADLLPGRAATFASTRIINLLLDGLEDLSQWLGRKIICFVYFHDFEANRSFILNHEGFGNLVNRAAERYGEGRLQGVRFMVAADQPFSPQFLPLYFFLGELAGFQGVSCLLELCRAYGLERDGRVPAQVLALVRQSSQNGAYLPGVVVIPLATLSNLARVRGLAYLDRLEWVAPDSAGGVT